MFSGRTQFIFRDSGIAAWLSLILLGLLTYAPAIFYPFVHDDVVFIQNNPSLAEFNLQAIFLNQVSLQPNDPLVNHYYRPFLEIVYRLEYFFFGVNPVGYHAVNIFLHICSSLLIYFLLGRMMAAGPLGALFAAVIFLVHPAQTEAVVCVMGISNLLFGFFLLLSLYFYARHARNPRLWHYLGSLASFVLALLTKEQAVILPFLIILVEMCFGVRSPVHGTRKGWAMLGYGLVLAEYFILRSLIAGKSLTAGLFTDKELILRLSAIPQALLDYWSILFFPQGLHYYRTADILQPWIWPTLAVCAILGAGVILSAGVPQPQKSRCWFGMGWFFITLLPVLNILPLMNEYSLLLTFEHFLYLPLLGAVVWACGMAQGWGAHCVQRFPNLRIVRGHFAAAALLVILVLLTARQMTYWRSEIALFERAVQCEPNHGRVRILLAKAYYFAGRFEDAIAQDKMALEIIQGYLRKVSDERVKRVYLGFVKEIHFDRAHAFEALGDFRKSFAEYQAILEFDARDSVIYNSLGVNFIHLGDWDRAVENFEKAVTINPSDILAMNNLAISCLKRGEAARAEKIFRDILQRSPQFQPARDNLKRLQSGFLF